MRKVIRKCLCIGIVTLVVVIGGCTSKSDGSRQSEAGSPGVGVGIGNDLEVTSGEQPVLKVFPTGAIVEFTAQPSESMEAWEVVTNQNETFLNYSRFPYGTETYKGAPVQVCTAVVSGTKYAGVSENRSRLKKAMVTTMMHQVRMLPENITCTTFSAVAVRYPTLEKLFESLK